MADLFSKEELELLRSGSLQQLLALRVTLEQQKDEHLVKKAGSSFDLSVL